MSHRARTMLIGLTVTYLVGYFSFWVTTEVDWFPGWAVGVLLILLTLRWMIGRHD